MADRSRKKKNPDRHQVIFLDFYNYSCHRAIFGTPSNIPFPIYSDFVILLHTLGKYVGKITGQRAEFMRLVSKMCTY
jgi:hypothetical protein